VVLLLLPTLLAAGLSFDIARVAVAPHHRITLGECTGQLAIAYRYAFGVREQLLDLLL
jgi:hypothetical protein